MRTFLLTLLGLTVFLMAYTPTTVTLFPGGEGREAKLGRREGLRKGRRRKAGLGRREGLRKGRRREAKLGGRREGGERLGWAEGKTTDLVRFNSFLNGIHSHDRYSVSRNYFLT